MKLNKPLFLLLAGTLSAGLSLTSAQAVAFTDTVGHSAEASIDTFAALGIVQGYGDGTFDPQCAITRGDMCTILSRVFTYTQQSENTFQDLDETLWYAKPMLQLNALGIIQGYGDGTIHPTGTITWEEALVMLSRAFSLEERSEYSLPYTDSDQISSWAIGHINALYAAGYLHSAEVLQPDQPFTRADVVVLLDSIIGDLGWEAAGKTVVNGVLVELEESVDPPNSDSSTNEEKPVENQPDPNPSIPEAPSDPPSSGQTSPDQPSSDKIPDSETPNQTPEETPNPPVDETIPPSEGTDSDPDDGRIETEGHNYPYDPNLFLTEDGKVSYLGNEVTTSYGIDVSTHQGEIDWQAVATDNVEFAIIRLGYRGYGSEGTLNIDARFEENMQGALDAGIKVGVYFFSQAISVEEALEEAAFVLEALEPYRDQLTFPVIYDWEDIGTTTARTYKLDNEILNACALAFCGAIEEANYETMIYFYPNLGKKRYDLDVISQYPFWYCRYDLGYPDLERPFRIWQYSDHGTVNGIEGDVDLNLCFWPY